MPVVYVSATATLLEKIGGYADGTAEATRSSPPGAASGTLDVDRRTYTAFISPIRLMRPEVYVTDMTEPIAELVDQVEISEALDDLVPTASFSIAKAEASPFHASSLTAGNKPCRIELFIGPPGGVGTVNYTRRDSIGFAGPPAADFLDGVTHPVVIGPCGLVKYALFEGYTDSIEESGAHRVRARVQTIAGSSLWADLIGCVTLNAFAGYTRAQIVAMLAESIGVTVTGLDALPSAKVYKPVDEMGKSVLALIRRYGEIEGWRARLSADGAGIEVLSEDRLLDGSPVFEFDESNSFNMSISTPSRPVTDWVLSGTRIVTPTPETKLEDEGPSTKVTVNEGTDAGGEPIRMVETVEMFAGVERRRVTEVWRMWARDGVTPLAKTFQITDRITVLTDWADFWWYDNPLTSEGLHIRPSTQMSKRVIETETITGTRASDDYGGYSSWADDWWTLPLSDLVLIERQTETFNWSVTECKLLSSDRVIERPFSPRLDPNVETTHTYKDGTERADPSYALIEVERFSIVWSELVLAGSAPKTTMQEQHYSYFEMESPDTADVFIDSYKLTDTGTIVWQGDLAGLEHTKTTTVISLGEMNSVEVETLEGPPPVAPRGDTEQATFQQEVILKVFRASAAAEYIKREESPSAIDFAESIEELETWARRRLRRDHARHITISHRALPFLRVGDFVTVSCASKELVDVRGYVTETTRTIMALNGGARQTTTIAVPPDWV